MQQARWILPAVILMVAPCLAQTAGTPIPGTSGPGSWFLLAPMLHQQNEAASAVIDGKVYVIGGFEMDAQPTTRVQVYGPASNKWSEATSLPEGVHHAAAAVVDNKIYLVGGFRNVFSKRDPID